MIVLENEKSVKKEIVLVFLSFVFLFLLLKIIFYKDETTNILKLSSSIFFLFFLPYFLIMCFWIKELNIAERMIFAIISGLAINGIFGYYLGMIGFNLNHNYLIIALTAYFLGVVLIIKVLKLNYVEEMK